MKKKKLTGKQIKFIVNMICLGIFCFSYLYIYEVYQNKTEAAYEDSEFVKAQIRDRKKKLSEEDSVREKILEINDQKQTIIDHFPVLIEEEDNFMFVEQMEKELKIKTSSISTSDNTVFYNTVLPAQDNSEVLLQEEPEMNSEESLAEDNSEKSQIEDNSQKSQTKDNSVINGKDITANDPTATMISTYNTLTINFMTNYNGFKDMVDYIRDYPNHTIIDSVAVSYDSSTGALAGNMVLKRFALMGTGKEYKAPSIDGIDIGIDNIFGTGNNKTHSQ